MAGNIIAAMPTTQTISKKVMTDMEREDDVATIAATPVLVIIISDDELDIINGIK